VLESAGPRPLQAGRHRRVEDGAKMGAFGVLHTKYVAGGGGEIGLKQKKSGHPNLHLGGGASHRTEPPRSDAKP